MCLKHCLFHQTIVGHCIRCVANKHSVYYDSARIQTQRGKNLPFLFLTKCVHDDVIYELPCVYQSLRGNGQKGEEVKVGSEKSNRKSIEIDQYPFNKKKLI